MAVINLENIKNSVVERLSTGFSALDSILGSTNTRSGFPIGRITYMSGSPGIGKTRLAISIAKAINSQDKKIMYFQGEAPLEEFRQWTGNDIVFPEKFHVSDDRELQTALDNLNEYRPDFVVIDSANMIEGFSKQDKCRIIFDSFKEKVAEYGSHCLMIGHLTKDGKTKGSADVEHLVDVVCKVDFPEPIKPQKRIGPNGEKCVIEYELKPNYFKITVGKNRYGRSGGWAIFRHTNSGIEYVSSNLTKTPTVVEQPQERIGTQESLGSRFLNWLSN